MLVLHVIRDLFSHGGTPKKLLGLVKASTDSDVQHSFMVFDDTSETLVDEFRAAGASVVAYSRKSAFDPRLVVDIAHSARSMNADVIATHFARADVLGAIAGHMLGVPVVKHVHGIIVNEHTLVRFADRAVAPYRAAVVCNSEATMAAELKRNGTAHMQVVLNGVDEMPPPSSGAREQVRAELGISPEEYVIGHVGGLIPSRDQHLLIEATAQLRARGVPARCLLVGDGPEAARLEAVAEDVGVARWVLFRGYCRDVPELLAAMDVYVNMSRAEGFGIAVVEAMRAGLPVVVANAGALPELVTDGVEGFLAAVGDLEALTAHLAHLSDPEVRSVMGEHSLTTGYSERFAVRRFAAEINGVYRRVGRQSGAQYR